MKCDCNKCHGNGTIEIECPDCDGEGDRNIPIERIDLDRSDEHYPELLQIQLDAQHLIHQAAELANLKPHRADSYARQTAACLAILDHEAQSLRLKTEN